MLLQVVNGQEKSMRHKASSHAIWLTSVYVHVTYDWEVGKSSCPASG
jgi:hypothetical protein